LGSIAVAVAVALAVVSLDTVSGEHELPDGKLIAALHAAFSSTHASPQKRHERAVHCWQSLPICAHDNAGVGGVGSATIVLVGVPLVVVGVVVGFGVGAAVEPGGNGVGGVVGSGVGTGVGEAVGQTASMLLHTARNSHLSPHHAHALPD
jgi:hypothetical protein